MGQHCCWLKELNSVKCEEDRTLMTVLINSYSFIVIGLLILIILTSLSWHLFGQMWATVTAVVTAVLLITLQTVSSTTSDQIHEPNEFDNILHAGRPVLLELYSNFWVACLAAKPDVDRLELKLSANLVVVRLNISSKTGKYVKEKYKSDLVPTFIIFDKNGTEVWRQSGRVPKLETILSLNL